MSNEVDTFLLVAMWRQWLHNRVRAELCGHLNQLLKCSFLHIALKDLSGRPATMCLLGWEKIKVNTGMHSRRLEECAWIGFSKIQTSFVARTAMVELASSLFDNHSCSLCNILNHSEMLSLAVVAHFLFVCQLLSPLSPTVAQFWVISHPRLFCRSPLFTVLSHASRSDRLVCHGALVVTLS